MSTACIIVTFKQNIAIGTMNTDYWQHNSSYLYGCLVLQLWLPHCSLGFIYINLYDVQDDDYNLKYDNAYNLYHNDVDGVNVGHGQSLDNINGCWNFFSKLWVVATFIYISIPVHKIASYSC